MLSMDLLMSWSVIDFCAHSDLIVACWKSRRGKIGSLYVSYLNKTIQGFQIANYLFLLYKQTLNSASS